MDRLGAGHRGWLNLRPGVREEDAPPDPSGLTLLFAASPTHEVPVCTWVAGKQARHGLEPDSLGVQHATGTRVVARLEASDAKRVRAGDQLPLVVDPARVHLFDPHTGQSLERS